MLENSTFVPDGPSAFDYYFLENKMKRVYTFPATLEEDKIMSRGLLKKINGSRQRVRTNIRRKVYLLSEQVISISFYLLMLVSVFGAMRKMRKDTIRVSW